MSWYTLAGFIAVLRIRCFGKLRRSRLRRKDVFCFSMYQMISRHAWWSRFGDYFWWTLFLVTLFLAPNLAVVPDGVARSYFSWLDTLATIALAFDVVVPVVALAGAILLMLLEALTGRTKSQGLRMVPRVVVFMLFLALWLRLLRGTLRVYKIDVVPVEYPWEIWLSVLIAAVLIALFRAGVSNWVEAITQRVRLIGVALILITLPLSFYLVIEPFNQATATPVTLAQPDRKHPNVVVIVLDALTSRDMSLYGYRLPTTPNLDRLTQTWTVFENAHSTGTGTVAVQPAILTGRYPFHNEWHRYGDLAHEGRGLLNLAQILDSFGYRTIYGIGGGWWPSRYHLHHSFDQILGGGYVQSKSPGNPVHTFPGHELLNRTVWNPGVAEAFLLPKYGKLDGAATTISEPMYATAAKLLHEQAVSDPGSPFFLYLHMSRPHHPFIANEFLGSFLPVQEGLVDVRSQAGFYFRQYPADQQPVYDRLRLRYNENILKADQQLGELIATLQELDLYDQSLIVITADHGESYTGGYHGYFTPRLAAAEHSIPLLVKFPGQTEGRRVSTTVSNVDVLPTVLDVVGAAYPPEWLDGRSLLHAEHHPDRIVYVSRVRLSKAVVDSSTVAAISGDLKLVRRQGDPFLYNLADDPEEQVNLLGRVEADGLKTALDAFARREQFVRTGGDITQAPALIQSTADPRAAN